MHCVIVLYMSLTIGATYTLYSKHLCPNKKDRVSLNCSSGVIHLRRVLPPPYTCTPSSYPCVNSLEQSIEENCTQKSSCHISINKHCPSIPRHVTISYKCFHFWQSYSTDVCTNALEKIYCTWGKIKIQQVWQRQVSMCGGGNNEITGKIKELCNDKRNCDKFDDMDLSQDAYLEISYYCADNSFTVPTELPDSTTTKDNTVDFDEGIKIKEEKQNVVLLSWTNETFTLCAEGWDDLDASIVCKSLKGQNGRAIHLDNPEYYSIWPVVLNCSGNEKSILDCPGSEHNCSNGMVAGVQCYAEPLETSAISGTFVIEMGVGILLAVIGISVIVVLIICMKRRSVITKDKKANQPRRHVVNQNEDYTGQQGFALPNTSRDATNNHNVQYTRALQSESGRYRNQINVHNAMELYSLASNPNGHDDPTYAASHEGVYDHAHDWRHAESEANTYAHSVDGVYDSSNQLQRCDVDGDLSYGRVVDTVYDSSGHGGVPKDSVDNTYSRTVDTAYDTAGNVKRKHSQDNIYD